jgi:hypothetical protein
MAGLMTDRRHGMGRLLVNGSADFGSRRAERAVSGPDDGFQRRMRVYASPVEGTRTVPLSCRTQFAGAPGHLSLTMPEYLPPVTPTGICVTR